MKTVRELLRPSSIAVVGATDRPSPGRRVVQNLLAAGFSGDLYPVNPKYAKVEGHHCYPSLSAIDAPIECVVLAIAADRVPDVVSEAVECRVSTAVVLSSGFAESDDRGEVLHRRLEALAGPIRIVGPNCMGYVNVHDRIAPYSGPIGGIHPGSLAIVTQSGAVGCSLANAAESAGLGLSYLISSGNCLDLETSEYLDFLVDDPNTRVIALYLEDLSRARDILDAAARANGMGKHVITLKAGFSEAGQRVVASHTAALASSKGITQAAFRQAGAPLVNDLEELLQCLAIFCRLPAPRESGTAVATISGAEAALVADLAADLHLSLPVFAEDTCRQLRATLPEYAPIANPLDTTGAGIVEGDNTTYERALELVAQDPATGLVVVVHDVYNGLQVTTGENTIFREIACAAESAFAATNKPFAVLSPTAGPIDLEARATLGRAGIHCL